MATHSSTLAWRIPGTEEPGGLPSMGSHRVGHNWLNLAAAAAAADDDNYSPNYSLLQVPVGAGEKNRYKYISGAAKPQIDSFLVNSAQSREHKYLRIYRTKFTLSHSYPIYIIALKFSFYCFLSKIEFLPLKRFGSLWLMVLLGHNY